MTFKKTLASITISSAAILSFPGVAFGKTTETASPNLLPLVDANAFKPLGKIDLGALPIVTVTSVPPLLSNYAQKAPPPIYHPTYVAPVYTSPAYVAPTYTAPTPTASAPISGGYDGIWACIAQHESTGNPSENNGNGYYSGLQFSMSTWNYFGGTGNPANASIAEQEAIANKVLAAQGWQAWPSSSQACGV